MPIHEIDNQEWNKFLLTTSESTYFCTTDHWQTFNDAYLLQIRDEKNELIAGIPFRTQSVIPFIARFFKFCRVDSSALVNQAFNETEVYFLKKLTFLSLIKYLRKARAVFLFISPMTRSHDAMLLKELGFGNDRCATLNIDLTKDENEIFKSFSKGNKSSIHMAQKRGVQIKFFEGGTALTYVSDFCKLQDKLFENKRDSYSRISYKSESFLNNIFRSTFTKSYIALAYYNNQPAAAAILISYNKLLYYYLGASDFLLTKDSNASNLLQYEIIKYAKTIDCINYDLGGIPFSSDPSIQTYGVYKFKKSFGGVRSEYDIGNFVIRKYQYWIIRKLLKHQYHPIVRFGYKLLKGNSSA
jgi:lipid II:glycine glycyltransferase (peptidoglycan interpeptide bridge formation enzyme)